MRLKILIGLCFINYYNIFLFVHVFIEYSSVPVIRVVVTSINKASKLFKTGFFCDSCPYVA